MKPPAYIDGAKVIKWAWSGEKPFGYIDLVGSAEREEVYGLAICIYEKPEDIYRFSCDKNWETVNDAPYASVEDAILFVPVQYKNVEADWQSL